MDSLAGRQAGRQRDRCSYIVALHHLIPSCLMSKETYLVTAMCVLETAVPRRIAQQDSTTLSSYAHSRSS